VADPTGLAVVVVDNDAVLTWAGSPTPYVADYSIFRRSPSTGAVFNPAGSPIASGITSLTYADNDLPTGSYDWQVFGRVVVPTVAPTITSPSSTSFTQSSAGTFTVTATGTPPPTLSMTGTLPAGVTFTPATGVLAGTPTASGTFPLVFTAANGTLPNAVQNFTLTVAAAFVPTGIANCVGWWTGDDPATIIASAGLVSQWSDKSTAANHLTQGTSAWQPLTGRTLNGRNTLDFQGVFGNGGFLTRAGAAVTQPATWFAVAVSDVTGATKQITGYNTPAGGTGVIWSNVGKYSYYAGAAQDGPGSWNTSAHQVSAVFNGASSGLWVDGASQTAGNPGTLGFANFTIGSNTDRDSPWDGAIAEVIVYSRALNTTERQQVEAYLKAKWGTP
jgi:Putative Ig domain/Concanavalin A-like lectin/glucanases superfamily